VTDIGANGALFISNGTIWRPLNGSCVLAASSVAASFTGSTTETTITTVTIPANLVTANAALEIETLWSFTSNANNKTPIIKIGSIAPNFKLGI
jgi:hypothetical protein